MKENAFWWINKYLQGDTERYLSKQKIALMLSKISVVNEFFPESPWTDEEKVWKQFDYNFQGKHIYDLQTVFSKVIHSIVDEHNCIAIAFSGGLDSLAILLEVYKVCINKEKKCIAITAEVYDDKNVSCALYSKEILEALNVNCEHIIFVPKANSKLYWTENGPRAEAIPSAVQEMAELAKFHNADVILSGVGADSILGCPKYLIPIFIKQGKYKQIFRNVLDTAISGFWAIRREFASLLANKLSPYSSAKTYMALSDAELCDVETNEHLNDPYLSYVNSWSKRWLISYIELLMKHHYSWAKMEAISMLEMYDPLSPAADIKHINPYENPEIVKISTEIPLEYRYNHLLQSPYLRDKAMVVSLIDPQHLKKLPLHKKTFKDAITEQSTKTYLQPEILIKIGILNEKFIEKLNTNEVYGSNMLSRIIMLEIWLQEALDKGYQLR